MAHKIEKKQAQFLQVGDKIATGTVTHAPYTDTKTPSGKINIGINGIKKTWNKRTEIGVIIEENKTEKT
jgi:hypothetical protein